MKAIATHAILMELARDRVKIGKIIMMAVKCGVEAGDLRKRREAGKNRTDRRQIVRLMQRRECRIVLKPSNDAVIDQRRLILIRPAMDHPVPDRQWCDPLFVPQPIGCHL